jgi:hypothetical protein
VHRTGPPEDWEPPPPPDDYCFDSNIRFRLIIYATGCDEIVNVPGIFRILRGGPHDLDGDGNETIDTLMLKEIIAGASQCLGPFRSAMRSTTTSLGQVRSLAPAEFFPADSFFDVFVGDLETAGGSVMIANPVRMTTTVNALPPGSGEIYYGPGNVIPIFVAGNPNPIGEIRDIEHIIKQRRIPCPTECLPRIRFLSRTSGTVDTPESGAGESFDVLRGSLNALRASMGTSLGPVSCISPNAGNNFMDTLMPTPGTGLVYLARDRFSDFIGTYNTSSPSQVGNRDPLAAGVCPP